MNSINYTIIYIGVFILSSSLINRFFKHMRTFSPYYAGIELLTVLDRKVSLLTGKAFSHKIMNLKKRYILSWGRSYFSDIIEEYAARTAVKESAGNEAVIWICWLQGEERMPAFIDCMIKRVQQYANGHPVKLVSFDNFRKYCTLPDVVIGKYQSGEMPMQQFADILRAALLSENGGLWVDASVYVVRDIPEEVFRLPIYNIKRIKANEVRDAVSCDGTMWQAYFIASKPHSVTYDFIYKCFVKYWNTYDTLIDYFLMSYLAKIAREDILGAKEEYEEVPNNNYDCEQLSDYLMESKPFSADKYEKIMSSDTFIYKLTWKGEYPRRTINGMPTMAEILLREDLADGGAIEVF